MAKNGQSIKSIEKINDFINKMEKKHHLELLRIICKDNSQLVSENKNGVFVNLVELPIEVIGKIQSYITYIEEKEKDLITIEKEKNKIFEDFQESI